MHAANPQGKGIIRLAAAASRSLTANAPETKDEPQINADLRDEQLRIAAKICRVMVPRPRKEAKGTKSAKQNRSSGGLSSPIMGFDAYLHRACRDACIELVEKLRAGPLRRAICLLRAGPHLLRLLCIFAAIRFLPSLSAVCFLRLLCLFAAIPLYGFA